MKDEDKVLTDLDTVLKRQSAYLDTVIDEYCRLALAVDESIKILEDAHHTFEGSERTDSGEGAVAEAIDLLKSARAENWKAEKARAKSE